MEIKLQLFGSLLFAILLGMFGWNAEKAFAQLVMESDEPVTVAFYEGAQPPSDQRLHYFAVSEFPSILSEDIRPVSAGYPYISGQGSSVYPGKIELSNVPGAPFSGFSLQNQSGEDFEEMEFIFDFLADGTVPPGSGSIRLIYRKNEGNWADIAGGRLNLSSFQGEEQQETVSMQLMMNDLFVSSGDMVDFVWVSDGELSNDFPIYLQQIKLFPHLFSPALVNRGDLLITEIMSSSDIGGQQLEYLEIYNPSEKPLSLKGMTIETELGSLVIDKEFNLPGYQLGVIANADLSELEQVSTSYFYQGSILPAENGRIDLTLGGTEVASATYGSSEANRSFELIEAGYATDGYTSMQHLEVSSRNFFSQLWGSPGEFGRTLPLFKKEYTLPGTYLLSVPGMLKGTATQYRDLEFFTLEGMEIAPSEIKPYEPVIMVKEHSEPVLLTADGINLTGHQSDIFTTLHGNFQFLIPTNPASNDFWDTIRENREINSPVYGEWNSRLHRFDLVVSPGSVERDGWAPLVTSYSRDENSRPGSMVQIGQNENNLWLFSLTEPEDRSSGDIDEIAVGFSESSLFTDGVPKAIIHDETVRHEQRQPVLYVSSSEANVRANSFIQLGTTLTEKKEIVIGIDKSGLNSQMQAQLRWNLPDIIPEEWTLTLTDPSSGTRIDMRQQDRYQFRIHPSENRQVSDNETIRFQQVDTGQANEFIITMTPRLASIQSEEVAEIPGEIELRQNYPNPFNPTTNIAFFLPEERQVKLGIYNIVGQQVAALIEDNLQAGEHSIVWDASNSPSGIYIVQLESGSRTLTRKITLVK